MRAQTVNSISVSFNCETRQNAGCFLGANLMMSWLPITQAKEFNYNHIELVHDTSKTENTASGPIGKGDGDFQGVSASELGV